VKEKPGGLGGRKPALYMFVISPEENSVTRGCAVPTAAAETVGIGCEVPAYAAETTTVGIGSEMLLVPTRPS